MQSEIDALKKSVGCSVCEDGFHRSIEKHEFLPVYERTCVQREDETPKSGQLCGWSSIYEYDPSFDETHLNHDGSLVCSECSEVLSACKWCSSNL